MAMTTMDDMDIVANRQLWDPNLSKGYLQKNYARLRRHYKWLRHTQSGTIKEWQHNAKNKQAYRWRGRTESHTLTSGMFDSVISGQIWKAFPDTLLAKIDFF